MPDGKQYYQVTDIFPHLKRKERYIGTRPCTMRSGWEISFVLYFLDVNPSVVSWASETIIIQYINPLDGKSHRYFTDFNAVIKNKNGEVKEYIFEIKPFAQT